MCVREGGRERERDKERGGGEREKEKEREGGREGGIKRLTLTRAHVRFAIS